MNAGQQEQSRTVIVLANSDPQCADLSSSVARVGTLPILLRAILSVHDAGASRIIVCQPPGEKRHIKSTLCRTGRLPRCVEWREIGPRMSLGSLLGEVAVTSETLMVVVGNRTYQPGVLQRAIEWKGTGALALMTDDEPVGVYVFPESQALDLASQSKHNIQTLPELYTWMQSRDLVEVQEVPASSWHNVVTPQDLPEAERKLDSWLVKPTDGLFARNNRRISIPISRVLIKLPLTPNMVTMLVLGVSIASGVSFARGGYWNTLLGAALSVAASILDGCDGEVARLKLQSTRFGCWLETVCDYLYYLLVFGGMAVGLTRSSGTTTFLAWGALLCFGAMMSFLAVSFTRQRLSGSQPEKFLAVWQKKADRRSSNPLLYVGRQCEFIIRRCFFPYALLFFSIVNLTKVAFVTTALGANVVWVIALYSVVTFSRNRTSGVAIEDSGALSEQASA
jgi:phosphatidylglycerophosphate synthase